MPNKNTLSVTHAFQSLKDDIFTYENYDPPYDSNEIVKIIHGDSGIEIDVDTKRGFFAHPEDAQNVISALQEALETEGIAVEYVPDERHEQEPEKWSKYPGLKVQIDESQDTFMKLLRAHNRYKADNPVLSSKSRLFRFSPN